MEQRELDAINKLSRQLRAIKVMMAVFMTIVLVSLAVLGYMVWTVVSFTRDVTEKVTNIQTSTTEALDFKSKVCDSDTIGSFLSDKSDLCKE